MIQLTPIVKHLVLLNVAIFVIMFFMPAQYKFVYDDYFVLHKPAPSLVRNSVQVDGVHYYLPTGIALQDGTVLKRGNAQAIVDASPTLQAQIRQEFAALKADRFKPLQIITHFFSHSITSIFHIFMNMFVLASFGPILEVVMGAKRFLRFYLFCGVIGGLLIALLDPSLSPVVGASGAIFGVMVAFAMYFPKEKLNIMFIPIGIEARKLVAGFGVISLVFVVLQYLNIDAGGPISHFGHLAGMIAAILYFYIEKFIPSSRKVR